MKDERVTKKKQYLAKKKNSNTQLLGIMCFFMLMGCIAILGLIVPIRPSVSQIEKRNLTEFPEANAESIFDGSYFSQISLWYSDTYPFREKILSAQSFVASLYGIQGEVLTGPVSHGDEIPTAPMTMTDPIVAGSSSSNIAESSSNIIPSIPDIIPTETSSDVTSAINTEPSSEIGSESSSEAPSDITTADNTDPPIMTVPDTTEEPTTAAPEPTTPEPTSPSDTTAPPESVDTTVPNVAPEAIGSVYIVGNAGYDIYYFGLESSNQYISAINKAAALLDGKAQVYTVMVPAASSILLSSDQLAALGSSSLPDALNYVNSSFSPTVRSADAYSQLMAHRNEYIYFRTDHHWTAMGAYYAYLAWAEVAGITPLGLDKYTQVEYPGLLGSLYSASGQSAALGNTPDSVVAFIPPDTNTLQFLDHDLQTWRTWPVINDVSSYSAGNKYGAFIAGDEPLEIIKNPNNNNGKSCLVFKDSYGNPFVPYLISHYQNVYVIDPRYYSFSLLSFVNEYNINDVIYVNSVEFLNKSFADLLNASLY